MRNGTNMTHYGKLTISLTLLLLVGLVCGKVAVFCCLLLKQRCQELFSAYVVQTLYHKPRQLLTCGYVFQWKLLSLLVGLCVCLL